ncbi:heterokaryon incompatibility protein-domain-containing protein [Daldinia loculata]|nr:heterokaryon incompatibility protein-domain-containing protein [Daldinia loculata]
MVDVNDDHPNFDNDSTWPRRLLHVPSMTSCKWAPGNSYGGKRNPSYIAVSYTWGRFQLRSPDEKPHVGALPIRGVPWTIPRVDPDVHFTVDEFQHIIYEMMKTAERHYEFDHMKSPRALQKTPASWLVRPLLRWLEKHRMIYEFLRLDIACIDQRAGPIQMAEIGRQARIFQNAKYSYVWLSHLSHHKIGSLLDDLSRAITGLQAEPFHSELRYDADDWILLATQAIRSFTDDPWFKSLWTLQEGYLCNHSIILSREGRVSCDLSKIVVRTFSLNYLFQLTYHIISWSERTTTPSDDPKLSQLMDLVHRTGLAALFCNNPMGLLGVSYNRNPTNELDRVYGIMQTLGTNFRVGTNSSHRYTLRELEDEFGDSILRTYPVLSQMHVHIQAPAIGAGWRVQGNSRIPWMVERGDMFGWNDGNRVDVNIEISPRALCNLSTKKIGDTLWAQISGKACSFEALRRGWLDADNSEHAKKIKQSLWRMHGCTDQPIHMIYFPP